MGDCPGGATSASHAPPCSLALGPAHASFSSQALTDDLAVPSRVYESRGLFSKKSSLVALPPEEKLSNEGSCVRIGGIAEYDDRGTDEGSAALLLIPRGYVE